jgi:hypothetical protein
MFARGGAYFFKQSFKQSSSTVLHVNFSDRAVEDLLLVREGHLHEQVSNLPDGEGTVSKVNWR